MQVLGLGLQADLCAQAVWLSDVGREAIGREMERRWQADVQPGELHALQIAVE